MEYCSSTTCAPVHIVYANNSELYNLRSAVSELTGVSIIDMRGRKRFIDIVEARQLYCAAACQLYPQNSYACIGALILRNHATVMYHNNALFNKATLKDARSRRTVEMFGKLISEK
jgi:chromosomal replication initiation ATPase DnaA